MLKDGSVKNSNSCKTITGMLLPFMTVCLIFFSAAAGLDAKTSKKKSTKKASQSPIHVESDKMTAAQDSSMVEFSGNVTARQDDATITADTIQIYFQQDNSEEVQAKTSPDDPGRIRQIISSGNVVFTQKDRKAYADKADYNTLDDVLVLTGEAPKLETGSSFVTGKKITLYRRTDQVIVEGGESKRVQALIHPDDDFQDKKKE